MLMHIALIHSSDHVLVLSMIGLCGSGRRRAVCV
jgi:hypothetical protein